MYVWDAAGPCFGATVALQTNYASESLQGWVRQGSLFVSHRSFESPGFFGDVIRSSQVSGKTASQPPCRKKYNLWKRTLATATPEEVRCLGTRTRNRHDGRRTMSGKTDSQPKSRVRGCSFGFQKKPNESKKKLKMLWNAVLHSPPNQKSPWKILKQFAKQSSKTFRKSPKHLQEEVWGGGGGSFPFWMIGRLAQRHYCDIACLR